MARGAKNPSEVFASVLAKAKEQLLLDAKQAEEFKHKGIRGNERAAALATFLRDHLPQRFSVTKGEAIDSRDSRTGELDLIIYDAQTSSPVARGEEHSLIAAEALYAVIEVKTTLSAEQLGVCYSAAAKIRQLKPFGHGFVRAGMEGAPADDEPRCMYSVFSYFSDLGEEDWLGKEHIRILMAAKHEGIEPDVVDRVLVLSRGFILPGKSAGKEEHDAAQSVFLDFYLHLMNFLGREGRHRKPIDWQMYGPRTSPGWKRLA
jgi:uncharacterized protein DUF6602